MTAELRTLLVLMAVAAVSPALAARARVPTPVVLILAGLGLGPGGLRLVHATLPIAFLGELGFLVIMFIAGMEIDLAGLRAAGWRAMVRPLVLVAAWSAAALGVGWWLGLSTIMVLALCATSVGLPVAALHESGLLKTPLGQTVLLLASLGEFVVIMALTGYELFIRFGLAPEALLEVGKLAALFAISAVVISWSRAVVWWYPDRFERLVAHHDAAEIGVRVAVTMMLAFVLVAAGLGVEGIVGAFIAGLLFAFVLRERDALERKVAALGNGLFVPIFFVLVGVSFQPGSLTWDRIQEAALLLVVAGVLKLLPLLLAGPRELPLRQRAAAAALLSAPLTLVVAIGAVGERLGVVDAAGHATLLLLALGLSTVYPLIFRLLAGRGHAAAAVTAGPGSRPAS